MDAEQPSAVAKDIAAKVPDALAKLEACRQAWLSPQDSAAGMAKTAELRSALLKSLWNQYQQHEPVSWDECVQYYLALVATDRSAAAAAPKNAAAKTGGPAAGVLNQIRNKLSFPDAAQSINRSIWSSDRIGRHIVIAAHLEARLQQSGRFQPAVRRFAAAISASISTIKHHEHAAMSFQSNHRLPSFFVGFVSWLILGGWILAPRIPSGATAAAADQPLTNVTNALAAGAEEKLTYNGSTNCQRCHREPVEEDRESGRIYYVRMNESSTWLLHDRHSKAFKLLQCTRGQAMSAKLGYDVTKDRAA